MRIIAVDDERTALNLLTRAITEAAPDAELRAFQGVTKAIAELDAGYRPDAAFLDIEMPVMTGLELAKQIQLRSPKTNIIFITGYSDYAFDALSVRPSGYLMKPVDKEQILTELNNLRIPAEKAEAKKRIRVQCFGDFEVFVDGAPLDFEKSKAKELLAYMVERRGAGCSAARIAAALWEDGIYDRARQKQFSAIRSSLMKTLSGAGADEVVNKGAHELCVDPEAFECDYYEALSGSIEAINAFNGEYMKQYEWADLTAETLSERFGRDEESGVEEDRENEDKNENDN